MLTILHLINKNDEVGLLSPDANEATYSWLFKLVFHKLGMIVFSEME